MIRAKHNRRVNHELKFVQQTMGQIPDAGQLKILVPRHDEKKSRIATLTIRHASFDREGCRGNLGISNRGVDFPPPINRAKSFQHKSVSLNVIYALEKNPNPEEKAIQWLLLTTLEVKSFDQAIRYLRWYTYRWLIERYHYVLKSGCRIEQLQLKTAERIKKALATYTIVAWRLLWLTYEARTNPDLPCDTILENHEWQSLYCHFHGFPLVKEPPSIEQAVIWIARLAMQRGLGGFPHERLHQDGGFLARRHDGFPEVKTLWKGLQRLHDIAFSWKLLHSSENRSF